MIPDNGRGKQLLMYPEDEILVRDEGQSTKLLPLPLSQYLSADVSMRLINSGAPQTLAVINQEIVSVNAIIESLHILRILKSQTHNECSPISRLPSEILGEIFIQCLDGDKADSDTDSDNLDLPLILGHVCSAWRTIAWRLSPLWATVHCRVSHPNSSKKLADLLYQWLLRAQDLPISVKIDFAHEEAWAKLGTDAPLDILYSLMLFCKIWKDLDLVLPASWQRYLNAFNPLCFATLEKLKIRPPSSMLDYDIDIEGFLGAPRLCSIAYDSFPLRHLYFTWTNLTHGTFGGPSLNEVIELLSRCANLVTCNIFNPVHSGVVHPAHSILHTNLLKLGIYIEFPSIQPAPRVAIQILESLTTPLLQHILLTLPRHYTNPLFSVSELVEHSQCPLKHVEVLGPTISEVQIVDFLSESPVVHLYNN